MAMELRFFVNEMLLQDNARFPLQIVEGTMAPPQQETPGSGVVIKDEDREKIMDTGWQAMLRKTSVTSQFGETLFLHESNYFELIYMVQGNVLFLLDGEIVNVREGDILVINAGIPYTWKIPKGSTRNAIRRIRYIPEVVIESTNERKSIAATVYYNCRYLYIPADETINNELISWINDLLHEYRSGDLGCYNLQLSYLIQLSIKIARAYFPHICRHLDSFSLAEGPFKQILDYIHENFSRVLSLNEVSGRANMNKNYFCGYFKKRTGMSLNEYITHLRIMKASDLLRNSTYSITEIINLSGFDSHAQFYREFRRAHHMTPTDFKNRKEKML